MRMYEKPPEEKPARVVVTDLDIKFETMIVLLLKLAVAAIPAVILITIATVFVVSFWGGLLSSL